MSNPTHGQTNGEDNADEIPPWRKSDRKRGILTVDDREFLQNNAIGVTEEELDKQTIRDRRYRIRQRIINALHDFTFLVELDREDREKVFEKVMKEGGPTIQATLSFFYSGMTDVDYDYESDTLDLSRFVDALTAAIKDAERTQREFLAEVDVNIEVERSKPPLEDIGEALLQGRATFDEFFYFLEQEGDFVEVLSEVVERGEPLVAQAGSDDDERTTLIEVEQAREVISNLDDIHQEADQ